MKRFILFAGCLYYPYGGWDDKKGMFDTYEEALAATVGKGWDWAQVVDLTSGGVTRLCNP